MLVALDPIVAYAYIERPRRVILALALRYFLQSRSMSGVTHDAGTDLGSACVRRRTLLHRQLAPPAPKALISRLRARNCSQPVGRLAACREDGHSPMSDRGLRLAPATGRMAVEVGDERCEARSGDCDAATRGPACCTPSARTGTSPSGAYAFRGTGRGRGQRGCPAASLRSASHVRTTGTGQRLHVRYEEPGRFSMHRSRRP
jgi:hypothetical protein